MEEARFGLDPYHILLLALGISLLLSYWLPRLFVQRPPAATALLMLCGTAGSRGRTLISLRGRPSK